MRSSALGDATRVEPTTEDQRQAAEVSRAMAGISEVTLRLPGGEELPLPAALLAVLSASAG